MTAAMTTVLFLCFLEGILSLDNAIVLALLVRRLPEHEQRRALTYGIGGAFLFRGLSLLALEWLMRAVWVKFIGGLYLIYLAGAHFFGPPQSSGDVKPGATFWRTVLAVECMDIAFSVDSILAAISMTQDYWIVFSGGVLGIIMMRFAANLFGKILIKFPAMEHSAYALVAIIGLKLFLQGFDVDFHSTEKPFFWAFWSLLLASILIGFASSRHERVGV